jgi:hypothetical protein
MEPFPLFSKLFFVLFVVCFILDILQPLQVLEAKPSSSKLKSILHQYSLPSNDELANVGIFPTTHEEWEHIKEFSAYASWAYCSDNGNWNLFGKLKETSVALMILLKIPGFI